MITLVTRKRKIGKENPSHGIFVCHDCGKRIQISYINDNGNPVNAQTALHYEGWRRLSGVSLCPKCLDRRELTDLYGNEDNLKQEEISLLSFIADRAAADLDCEKEDVKSALVKIHFLAFELDFKKLFNADRDEFKRDILGIFQRICWQSGLLKYKFVPLCALNKR